jgi:hypothetical protein
MRGPSAWAAVVATLVVLLSLHPAAAQREQDAGSPRPSAVPSVADLVLHIPAALRDSCELTAVASPGEFAAAICRPVDPGVERVTYRQFMDRAEMDAAFTLETTAVETPGDADCTVGASLVTWSVNGEERGRLACMRGEEARTRFVWTDHTLAILAVAESNEGYAKTYDWWVTAGPESPAREDPPENGESVLYDAGDFSNWNLEFPWSASNGLLVGSDVDDPSGLVYAPVELPADDYIIEVEIQYPARCGNIGVFGQRCDSSGLAVRGSDAGYVGIGVDMETGQQQYFMAASGEDYAWIGNAFGTKEAKIGRRFHTWRVRVQGNEFELVVDGKRLLRESDNSYLTGRRVGFYTEGLQISARNLRVLAR